MTTLKIELSEHSVKRAHQCNAIDTWVHERIWTDDAMLDHMATLALRWYLKQVEILGYRILVKIETGETNNV